VSRIFLSHSSENNAEALALRDWLKAEGWDDVFLDLDPERGIKAGELWEDALREAADRCEAVIFLVSRAWLGSEWCRDEFRLVRHLRKRLFGVMIEDILPGDLPAMMTREWQLVSIAAVGETRTFSVLLPGTRQTVEVGFDTHGLRRLRIGLQAARLDAKHFAWPPESDPNRPPYHGLRPLEAEDAGIFFGRDAPVAETLDTLRGLRDGAPPRLLVILAASGAGKSSFLRAGLFPRLARGDHTFLPLPIIRPERAVISGETGLLRALEGAFAAARIATPRAELRAAICGGVTTLKPLLQALAGKATPVTMDAGAKPMRPALVLLIDQGEELFLAEAQDEAQHFLGLLRDLLVKDEPAIIVVFTIRSDNYERLQLAKELEGVRQVVLSLPPMPKGSYAEVIKGPARRLDGTARALKIEDGLVDALLADIEVGGATDALPLLAFTMERLYGEYHAGGHLKLSHYDDLGRVQGSIEAAVQRAFKVADADPMIPKDVAARLALLRRGLVPWLAGIDPDTGAPRRRVARLSEIPVEARPMIQHLVEQRLLTTDIAKDTGENTIEPAHEALLRQWGLLQGWLAEDAGLLSVIDGVKRASRDWAANGRNAAWLTHTTGRLEATERLAERPDLAANLEPTDREYLAACQTAAVTARRRMRRVQALVYGLLVGIIIGLVGWINQEYVKERMNWFITERPYMLANVRPYVLTLEAERGLKPLASFRECAKDCPEMIVIPEGEFVMGSPATEDGHRENESPQHTVSIAKPFAVSKFDVTFADWDACVSVGGCPHVDDSGYGRGTKPVINVNWDEAAHYVTWLSRMTGRPYRLLSEAEWEYAARAGTTTAYPWGDAIGEGNANCSECDSDWDNRETAPVGSFKPNAFGLYEMHGNVWQWVEDCHNDDHNGAPTDGSARTSGDCARRVVRGGSWSYYATSVRSAFRYWYVIGYRNDGLGFRVARTLSTVAVAPGAH
jgi:formylglycine-generating enzyme required for sulfatase activity